MNIFFLHRRRRKCVKYHVDKHVVKMILETAQLLCTAIWLCGGEAPYKMTHKNHPCAIWARQNKKHFRWLRKFGLHLCSEYTYRYGKVHKTEAVLRSLRTPDSLPDGVFHDPPQCMPDEYKVTNDCVQAYRNYYNTDKKNLHSWKGKIAGRPVPDWIAS